MHDEILRRLGIPRRLPPQPVHGELTYCMALKDAGGLLKMYAMVNAAEYQTVVTEATLEETRNSYIKAIGGTVDIVDSTPSETLPNCNSSYYPPDITSQLSISGSGDLFSEQGRTALVLISK